MTTPKLLTSPGKGHGLVDAISDPIYRALAQNQPTSEIVAIVILRPKSFGATDTADGRHQHVSFEAARLEPVRDANQANEMRYLLQALYEARTSTGEQRTLPLGLGGDREKQLALIERIEDWSKEQDLTGGQLEALWRETFGIGPDQDWSMGDSGIPGDYRKAGFQFLLEFAGKVGAVDNGEQRDAPADETGDEDESDPSDAVEKCQVCSADDVALTDGLCANCASNAGVPVKPEDKAVAAGAENVTSIGKTKRPRKTT